jgi:hypothetical protein
MQNLGLSDSTPQTQGRLKSLAWPTIGGEWDVEYLTRQGFSLCFLIAGLSLLITIFSGSPVGLLFVVYFYLAGVGIRARSRFAAVSAFVVYGLDFLTVVKAGIGPGIIIKIIILVLLGTNVRATFLAAKWAATQTEPPTAPSSDSFLDRFGDVWPRKMWPWAKYVFYAMTALMFLLLVAGIVAIALRVAPDS